MKLTEDWITAQAPGASAVQNGRKLSQKGSFSRLGRTEDNLFFGQTAQEAEQIPITRPLILPMKQRQPAAVPAQAVNSLASMQSV